MKKAVAKWYDFMDGIMVNFNQTSCISPVHFWKKDKNNHIISDLMQKLQFKTSANSFGVSCSVE